MQPTTNQLIARLIYSSPSTTHLSVSARWQLATAQPRNWAAEELKYRLANLNPEGISAYVTRLSSAQWIVPCAIRAQESTALADFVRTDLQIPIEPAFCKNSGLNDNHDDQLIDDLLLLSWIITPQHSLSLFQHPTEPNLLVQATWARLDYDLLLAFELSGLPSPKSYENWRKPDELDCPSRACVRHSPSLGACTVHFHNGELALVTSGDGLRAELVHVKALESTAPDVVRELLERNSSAKRSKPVDSNSAGHGVELSQEAVQALASKWF